jgi:hypothetical protein
MGGYGHMAIEGGRPEAIIFWQWETLSVRKLVKADALKARVGAILHFRNGIVHPGVGNHPHRDQSVGSIGAVFLGEPAIIGANHRLVRLIVDDTAPGAEIDRVGKQDLCVYTILLLLL